ncbi:MAG: ATP-binding protein [Planctomycetes bacterium]|nr:ATP-binding protein [Planctomycetota bacterium]
MTGRAQHDPSGVGPDEPGSAGRAKHELSGLGPEGLEAEPGSTPPERDPAPTFVEEHRRQYALQVRRVLLLRVVVIMVALAVLLIYEEGAPRLLAAAHVVLVLATAVSAAHLVAFRWVRDFERFVLIGLVLDFALATALCYLTGGVLNAGSTVLYFAVILEAVLLVSDRAGVVVASAATVALVSIAMGYWFAHEGELPLPGVPPALYSLVPHRWGRIIANLVAVFVAYLGVVLLATRLPYRVSSARILYDEVIERLRDGLVAIDNRGHIVLVNREACRLLNWGQARGLVGRRFDQVLRRREDRAVLDMLARGADVRAELTLEIRGRPPLDVDVTTTVLHDGAGRVRGVVGVFRDLSLKRRLEQAERRVARLAGTEEMALGIAHEIRTPLASIRGAVQELTREAPADEADRRLADIVRRESDRLDRLLQDFLDYARMRPPFSGPVDVGQVAGEVVELLRRRPDAGGVRLEVSAPDGGAWVVQGDGDLLRQALMNIGVNGVEALGGSGRLVVSLAEAELPHRSEGSERRVEARRAVALALDNDGPPIAPADAERIFTPFFTTKSTGHGLGLAIAQKIVRMHGGTISCEPSALGGACFRLVLPLV